MDTNDLAEYEVLAKVIDDEMEARMMNDEVEASLINDEIDAYKMYDEFEAYKENLEKSKHFFDNNSLSAEELNLREERMAKYLASQANHIPGKKHNVAGVSYTVQDKPHKGVWTRDEKVIITNPNLKNKSKRNRLLRNPKKFVVSVY